MIEIAWLRTKKKLRYVIWLGHGLPHYGQTALICLCREYIDFNGDVINADWIFSFPKNGGRK